MPRMVARSSRWRRIAASFWGVTFRAIGLRGFVASHAAAARSHACEPSRICSIGAVLAKRFIVVEWGQEMVIMSPVLPSISKVRNARNYMTRLATSAAFCFSCSAFSRAALSRWCIRASNLSCVSWPEPVQVEQGPYRPRPPHCRHVTKPVVLQAGHGTHLS